MPWPTPGTYCQHLAHSRHSGCEERVRTCCGLCSGQHLVHSRNLGKNAQMDEHVVDTLGQLGSLLADSDSQSPVSPLCHSLLPHLSLWPRILFTDLASPVQGPLLTRPPQELPVPLSLCRSRSEVARNWAVRAGLPPALEGVSRWPHFTNQELRSGGQGQAQNRGFACERRWGPCRGGSGQGSAAARV